MVNISTVKPKRPHDGTCILPAGEHPFIKHDSFVYYSKAVVKSENFINRGIEAGFITPKQTINNATLQRVIQGFKDSPHAKRKFKDLLYKPQSNKV